METPSSAEPVLQLTDVSLVRNDRLILSHLNLEVSAGEFVGIIGPNGAGKSTLLRSIAGLVKVSGSLNIFGRDISSVSIRQRAGLVAIMHQETNPDLPFPARDAVMMGRYARMGRFGAETPADRKAVFDAMQFTDTLGLAETPITRMSGGERQRVLFAKTVAQETPLVLLDEPSASLDISWQEQILSAARRLSESGVAVIAAIHDLRSAARHCTRLVLMAKGGIRAVGSSEEVLTPDLLSEAYGVRMRVWHNHISGLLDLHPSDPVHGEGMPHVHVIGGGGSGAGILRLLGDDGYRVSAGVLSPGDSDLLCAGIYGMPVVVGQPFSPINDSAFQDNCELASRADLTILCNCAWGMQNIRNLEAAACATSLLVLQDDDFAARDFTDGIALTLYEQLARRATVIGAADLRCWIENWERTMQAETERAAKKRAQPDGCADK